MTNKKSTKRALLLSALSLLLCVSMLVGSTFAWFTDSVTSGNNIIKSGNLDVELEYKKVDNGVVSTEWASVKDKTDIFNPNALWEPGHVEVVYLKVSNLGTLALKYQLGVNVIKETLGKTETGEDIKLSEYLVFKVVEMPDALTTYTDREAVKLAAGTAKGLTDYNGKTTALDAKGGANAEDYVALIVYMPETVGNEANYRGDAIPTIELGINLYATQYTAEEDSFDEFYDKNAWVKGFKVYSANELQGAINAGESAITLMDNIDATEAVVIPEGKTVALNLNGKTLEATADAAIRANGNLNLTGEGTIKGNAGQYVVRAQAGSTVTVDDGIVVEGGFGAVAVPGGTLIINGGNFSNVEVNSSHYVVSVWNNGKIIINGGNFTFAADQYASANGSPVIGTWDGGAVEINGGTFDASSGSALCYAGANVVVKGGTFMNAAAKTYGGGTVADKVATGYKAVENNGKYYVVAENINSVVSTAAELATAIANSGVVYVADDIDMANAWTSVKPNGELTIIGNGNTITNLNLPLLTGGVSSKVTISGLTVADSTVAPAAFENGLGSGAFIPYVDAYGNVTFEDCHIKNSTINGNERAAGLVGYTSGQSVTIKNCSVENCEISAVGGAAGLVAYSQSVTTIENCSVKNTKVTATEDREGTKLPLAGAVIGTVNANTTLTNVTVSGNTVSNNNATAVFNDYIGRWVTGELTIDGVFMLREASQTALNNAITSGKESISLPAGNYVMPASLNGGNVLLQGKTITISGTKDTVIDTSTISANDQFVTGATVAFDGVTLKFNESDPSKLYMGFANTASLTYKNCHITGLQILYGDKVTFENCVIDSSANTMGQPHSVWTYGAKNVNFIDCDFIYGNRAVNCYKDDDIDGGKQVVNFKNCTFTTTDTNSEGGVEINSSKFSVGIEVNMEGCTAPAYGQMAYVSPWDSTNGTKTTINIK
ncbi:MAG: hypothetical protein IJA47_02910 [Oscillospiraceae bacterium]|nr:hypothetical protein [Oscillospiraceae bacterium]